MLHYKVYMQELGATKVVDNVLKRCMHFRLFLDVFNLSKYKYRFRYKKGLQRRFIKVQKYVR